MCGNRLFLAGRLNTQGREGVRPSAHQSLRTSIHAGAYFADCHHRPFATPYIHPPSGVLLDYFGNDGKEKGARLNSPLRLLS